MLAAHKTIALMLVTPTQHVERSMMRNYVASVTHIVLVSVTDSTVKMDKMDITMDIMMDNKEANTIVVAKPMKPVTQSVWKNVVSINVLIHAQRLMNAQILKKEITGKSVESAINLVSEDVALHVHGLQQVKKEMVARETAKLVDVIRHVLNN